MRFRFLFHALSLLILITGICMVLPLVTAFIYGEADGKAFLISLVISLVTGGIIYFFTKEPNREITHKELGSVILDDVTKDLKEVAVVEQVPRMEGRQMFMILAPNPKVAQRARELARQQAAATDGGASGGRSADGRTERLSPALPPPTQRMD